MLDWDVVHVTAVSDQLLEVQFRDGVAGFVRFERTFFTGVFEPLKDPTRFRQVEAPDGFVTWPSSSLDLAPDAMHAVIKQSREMLLK
jgi:hypothetical protein